MLAVRSTSVQSAESVRALIVLLAIILVINWRAVLKIAIFILAVAVLALLGTGAFALLHHAHHLIK
jgi:hypothetical protein